MLSDSNNKGLLLSFNSRWYHCCLLGFACMSLAATVVYIFTMGSDLFKLLCYH